MKNYKQFFKGKKITVMGLGILGRGLGYTKFLAECGADLIVTDLKTKEQLKASVEAIKNYEPARPHDSSGAGGLRIKDKNSKNPVKSLRDHGAKVKFVLGEHRLENFKDRDMIIKSAGVPLDSIYIAEAKKNNIPVEMDVSLFAKCAPGVMIIGVTGTRGKSMTTTLIYEILSSSAKATAGRGKRNVYLGGNLRGVATLPLLKKVKDGDILVCELDSWQLQGFGEAKLSPHISVFTTFMPDHMNYYSSTKFTTSKAMERYFSDKANIFKFQKKGDILIIRPGMKKLINKNEIKGKLIVIDKKDVESWKFNVPGIHHRENMACAVAVAQVLGVPMEAIKKSIEKFKGLEGRLQLLKIYKGIKIYNDNNATTPDATIAGIEALVSPRQGLGGKKIVLICGGSDKNLPLGDFVKVINKYCKAVIFLEGSGTEKLIKNYKLPITNEIGKDLKDVIQKAIKLAKKGDTILFSPAFASFGMFNNEYERNDLFMKIVKKVK
ncbi:MAG: UDP-N-acetylmuramoyl-L-alanine--D-glutamate ligase [Candidatus Paceibacterota bacterium]